MKSPTVATYPFAGEQGEAHGCVFQRRKMRGFATNVYLWKTSEKPKETGHKEYSNLGVVFTFEEGISTSHVCLKGQQPYF